MFIAKVLPESLLPVMNKLRFVLIVAFTFCASLIFIPVYVLVHNHKLFYAASRLWARIVCWIGAVPRTVVRQASPTEPCVYVCNHRSLFDTPIVLAGINDSIRMMYKAELEDIPVFGWLLKISPFIAVNRGDAKDAVESMNAAIEHIKNGESVLLFPEGTWSTSAELLPFKRGAVVMALRSGKAIVPVGISGTERVLPPDTYSFCSAPVTVRVGAPMHIQCNSREEEKVATEQLRQQVQGLC